jgi:DnaJ-class molecular chaperone
VKDYYLILGVSRKATAEEIDAAFRRLATKYHPDVRPEEENAAALFKSAVEAYEVLSDVEQRCKYDRVQGRGRRIVVSPGDHGSCVSREFEDGGRSRTETLRTPTTQRDEMPRTSLDVEAELRLVPEEAMRGGPVELRLSIRQRCFACAARGRVPVQACAVCGGQGTMQERRMLRLQLPRQLVDGTRLCLAGCGKTAGPNGPRGDLHLLVRVRPCW